MNKLQGYGNSAGILSEVDSGAQIILLFDCFLKIRVLMRPIAIGVVRFALSFCKAII